MGPFGFEESEEKARHACTPAPQNPHKILVRVRADHDTDGTVRPVSFLMPDDTKIVIDKVLCVRQAVSLKAGGQGQRYTVAVTCGEAGKEMYLFDDDGVWFIEKD